MSGATFGFTKLVVGDLEKMAAFYTSVCGVVEQQRVLDEVAGRKTSEILYNPGTPGGPTFALLRFLDSPKPASSEVILGFMTPDIDAFLERALAAGGTIVEVLPFRPELGCKVALLKDIEGHMIQAVQML
jgi:catechol 2,3-dioxygenase-like lactoylglutathione lyase family enzyme